MARPRDNQRPRVYAQSTRISVEWMTDAPALPEGGTDYDHATWAFKEFAGAEQIEAARAFARIEAQRNPFGQVWIHTEHAPSADAREWEWERDYSADEIIEAESTGDHP